MTSSLSIDHCCSYQRTLAPFQCEPRPPRPFLTENDDIGYFNPCGGCLKCDTCKLLIADSDEGNEFFDAKLEKFCPRLTRSFDAAHLSLELPHAKRVKFIDQQPVEVNCDNEERLESLLREPILEIDGDLIAGSAYALSSKIAAATYRVHELLQCIEVTPFGCESIMNLAEQFIEQYRMFESIGRDSSVTIGYHYTASRNLNSISQHGLMSEAERAAKNVGIRKRIGWFGDGIYTANNPHAFVRGYGPTGLFVAILKGKTGRVLNRSMAWPDNLDTGVGNKKRSTFVNENLEPRFEDEIILKASSQVLPLAWFPSALAQDLTNAESRDILWQYHVKLQEMLDDFFHFGVKTKVERVEPSEKFMSRLQSRSQARARSRYQHRSGARWGTTSSVSQSHTATKQEEPAAIKTNAGIDKFSASGPQAHLLPVHALPQSNLNIGVPNLVQIPLLTQDLLNLHNKLQVELTAQQSQVVPLHRVLGLPNPLHTDCAYRENPTLQFVGDCLG